MHVDGAAGDRDDAVPLTFVTVTPALPPAPSGSTSLTSTPWLAA
jgi:hypothetical protein